MKEINYLAKLACISVSEKEEPNYQADLNTMLEVMQSIKTINIDGVEPLYSPLDENIIKYEDTPTKKPNKEELQNLSNHTEDGFYTVPKVI